MNFKLLNNYMGWLVFAIATLVYFLTLEPTAGWWDAGEYIATAYKLQVGHPPGAPLYQMLGRFFSLFAFGDQSKAAMMINAMAGLSSSFTILFLFWTITLLARKFMPVADGEKGSVRGYAILGAAAVGSLAYTFTDSFWFSAVEGEVYALSSLFTAVVFWAILKWERIANEPHSYKWLILIAYLIGLSIGVHLLNLLAIPAIVYIFYFKRYTPTAKGFLAAGILSVAILAFIMNILIPGIVELAGRFEIFMVNSLGLPFNVGTLVYFAVLIGLIVIGLQYTARRGKVIWNTIVLSFMFILIGYSSFFMLIIRANAPTPVNENNPSNAITMLAYLNREQYGTWPLLSGPYYSAYDVPYVGYEDDFPVYVKDNEKGKYVITDHRRSRNPVFDERFTTLFPRMHSNPKLNPAHVGIYKQYGGNKGVPVRVVREDGTSGIVYRPTFGENLRFFFSYQLNHMYFRYFMWNFAGRQNDIESQGGIENGNWVSGINFIDSWRLGNQRNLPESMKSPHRTHYYFLPLLLGLLGIIYHTSKDMQSAWVVFLLFFMTGIAIVVYLNQTPYQPRERDYSYAASFYAFAIWIGLGALAVYSFLSRYMGSKKITVFVATVSTLILVPGIMAREGWEGHDRSGRYATLDFAKNYLKGCAPNAILFTNGDNDTFPLWYAQEVEGFRTDMRVVNYLLASSDWHVHQMMRKIYESEPLPLTLKKKDYYKGVNEQIPIVERIKGPVAVKELIDFIANDSNQTKLPLQSGERINYLPSRKVKIAIDKEAVIKSGTVPEHLHHLIVDEMVFEFPKGSIMKNELMLLDLIATNNWSRPIYFANPGSVRDLFAIDKYCHLEGVVFRFMPVMAQHYYKGLGGISVDGSWEVLMEDVSWGRLHEPDVTVDRQSQLNVSLAQRNYYLLAQSLINENKADSAIQVLDKGIEFFPHEKFTFDYFKVYWAEIYLQAGATEKGIAVMRTTFNRYMDDLRYYNSLSTKFADYYSPHSQEALTVLQRLVQLADQYKLKDISNELEEAFMMQMNLGGI
jgi:hypothetical protein